MIYLIFGEDTFRSKEKLKEIVEKYQKIHKSGLNLKILDLEKLSFEDLKREFSFSSMFAEKKLLILKNSSKNEQFKKNFLKEIENFSKSKEIIFFFEEGKVKEDHFFKEIKKFGKFQEFKPLDKFQLKTWIKEKIKNLGGKIEEKAIQKLISFVGNELWRMSEEIKKLIAYKKGEEIKEKDVEILVSPNLELDVFKIIDAIFRKDKKIALKFIHSYLKKGEKPNFLFLMIKHQMRNLIEIKDLIERNEKFYQIRKRTELNPFVLEKILKTIQKFKLEELKKIYQRIFNLDLAIKTGRVEPKLALEFFLFQL
jgi:DNA polymerase-3 subunit delta